MLLCLFLLSSVHWWKTPHSCSLRFFNPVLSYVISETVETWATSTHHLSLPALVLDTLTTIFSLRARCLPKALPGRNLQVNSALKSFQFSVSLLPLLEVCLENKAQDTFFFFLGLTFLISHLSLPIPLRSYPNLGKYIFFFPGEISPFFSCSFTSKTTFYSDIFLWITEDAFLKLDLDLLSQEVSKCFFYYCSFLQCNITILRQNSYPNYLPV